MSALAASTPPAQQQRVRAAGHLRRWWQVERTRQTPSAIAGVALVAIASAIVGNRTLLLTPNVDHGIPYPLVLTVVSASLVCMTMRSPQPDLDRVAARSQPMLRAIHLAFVLSVVSALTLACTFTLSGPITDVSALRSLAGLIGLGLISTAVVGATWSWCAPTIWLLAVLTAGASSAASSAWAWPAADDSNQSAMVGSLGLLAIGLIVAIALPPRSLDSDIEIG